MLPNAEANRRNRIVPGTPLGRRLEPFRETGRVFRVPNELFAENSWIQVMLGQGIEPRQHQPVTDLMGDEELSRFLDVIQSPVERTVAQLPAHPAYVEQYCKAPARARCRAEVMANIYEVAELAGVSLATVSRVINPGTKVSEKTRQTVLDAMQPARLPAQLHRAVAGHPQQQRGRRAGLGAARSVLRRHAVGHRADR